jgi:hypothetical protein
MDARTRELVRRRADQRCEYCHLPENAVPYLVFHVDHIIAKQHLDEVSDDLQGLAWSCSEYNYHKGPNLVSIALSEVTAASGAFTGGSTMPTRLREVNL